MPELAQQGIFQLSRLSVNCCVKTVKNTPLFKPLGYHSHHRRKLWSRFWSDMTPPLPFVPDLAQRARVSLDRSGARELTQFAFSFKLFVLT